jgi:spectinomycin phosphotransferase
VLKKPDLSEEQLRGCLLTDFGANVAALHLLPLGADVDTAVYRAESVDGQSLFVKLRRGKQDPLPVLIPEWLHSHGVPAVMPPFRTTTGEFWTCLNGYVVTVTAFIDGRDGYERKLSDDQWVRLGQALRGLHQFQPPVELLQHFPRENFAQRHRERVRRFQEAVASYEPVDEVAAQVAALLGRQRSVVDALRARTERHAAALEGEDLEYVICHGGLHAGNVLLGDDDTCHLVDWDTLLLAPREKDLMAIGMGGAWDGGSQAELFYRGYGTVEVDPVAIAYYRCERIIQDIDAFCSELLLSDVGGADRERSLRYLAANFEPGGLVEVALAS